MSRCVVFVLTFIAMNLSSTKAEKPDIIEPPVSVDISVNEVVHFTCEANCSEEIRWELNNKPLSDGQYENLTRHLLDKHSHLWITTIWIRGLPEYNGFNISCLAFNYCVDPSEASDCLTTIAVTLAIAHDYSGEIESNVIPAMPLMSTTIKPSQSVAVVNISATTDAKWSQPNYSSTLTTSGSARMTPSNTNVETPDLSTGMIVGITFGVLFLMFGAVAVSVLMICKIYLSCCRKYTDTRIEVLDYSKQIDHKTRRSIVLPKEVTVLNERSSSKHVHVITVSPDHELETVL